MANDALSRVLDGRSWSEFCDQLKRVGEQILRPEAPADELNRAEGWRYLSRLTRIALEMHVEGADRDYPTFYQPSHSTAKIGADNPDNLYLRAEIDGRHDYRIRGERGSVHYLSFGTQRGGYEEDGRNEQTGFLDARQIQMNDDGTFEVVLSATQKSGNWLPMAPETRTVIVRQTFMDRKLERPATLTIERLDRDGQGPAPLTAETIDAGLKRAASFVEGTARLFADWSQSYLAAPNQMPIGDQALCQSVGGDPNILYYHGYFDLTEQQALKITLPRVPDCENWNLQVDNYWMESLDYRYFQIHVNKHTAVVADDGSVTIWVTGRDPQQPNWLNTCGHAQGTLCFRWIGLRDEVVTPVVELVELSNEVV